MFRFIMSDAKCHGAAQKDTFVIGILVTLFGLITVGCTELPAGLGMLAPGPTPEPWRLVRGDTERVAIPDVAESDLAELVAGNSAFAFDLYQAIRTEQGNLFYSPYSISVALAMTYAGACDMTERQMADTLHYTLPQDRLHPAFNALQQDLASRGETARDDEMQDFQLNIANALWGQVDLSFRDVFLNTLARYYGAGLRLLDFANEPEESRRIINNWVSEVTEGQIKDMVQPGVVDQATRLVLTNAVYFHARWEHPFKESDTQDGRFRLLDGSQVTVPMMQQTSQFAYTEGDNYQALELPYDGIAVSMLVLLPAPGYFQEFERQLSADRLPALLDQLEIEGVKLTMPKFEYNTHLDLKQTLSKMGMPAAFGPDANFSGITGDRSLFIEDVVHKAFVSVDEKGTEAAAATMVAMAVAEVRPNVEVTLDRPFIFLIRDNETGTILFLGRVVDPGV